MNTSTNYYLDLIANYKGSKDITFVLNTTEMEDLVAHVAQQEYEVWSVDHDGTYHYVSANSDAFFAEDCYSLGGKIKYNDTDILVLPNYLPTNLKSDVETIGQYDLVIKDIVI